MFKKSKLAAILEDEGLNKTASRNLERIWELMDDVSEHALGERAEEHMQDLFEVMERIKRDPKSGGKALHKELVTFYCDILSGKQQHPNW